MFVAWRKVVHRLWKLPNMTHCNVVQTINSSLPIVIALEKRCAKCIHSCLNSHSLIIKVHLFLHKPLTVLSLEITIDVFVINIRLQEIHVFY